MNAPSGKSGKATPRKGVRSLSQIVPELIAPAAKKFGFSSADLIGQWTEIAGADIAARCTPERIKWPRMVAGAEADGPPPATLILRAPAHHALDLSYETSAIAERVNAYFGYEAIGKITVRKAEAVREETPDGGLPSNEPLTQPDPSGLPGFSDGDLQSALAELRHHVEREGHDDNDR